MVFLPVAFCFAYSLSPFLRGEGWGEGLSPQIRSRGESPSPAALRAPTSPRKRGEVSPKPSSLVRFADLVLRPGIEITGLMSFIKLAGGIAPGAVDHATALHGWAFCDRIGPALYILVFVDAEEFAG